jgi:hypothetical protein
MKLAVLLFMLVASSFASANEVYNCEVAGPNLLLTFENDSTINLKNNFKNYDCEIHYTTFPGTEIEMKMLVCSNQFSKLDFYLTQYSETQIILSRNVVFSKDISCTKSE